MKGFVVFTHTDRDGDEFGIEREARKLSDGTEYVATIRMDDGHMSVWLSRDELEQLRDAITEELSRSKFAEFGVGPAADTDSNHQPSEGLHHGSA